MPTTSAILLGLTHIANRAVAVAVGWHLVLALALIALARGWRPSHRVAAALLAAPLASVAALAFAFGNPFNGVMFVGAAIALTVLGWRDGGRPVQGGPAWARGAGLAMIGFGWVYPHFLAAPPLAYLVAAPLGLVPCPTLSVVIGLALLARWPGRATPLTVAGLGGFYGLFGVVRLGVTLDLGLVAGAVALAVAAWVERAPIATAAPLERHLGRAAPPAR